jgi:two-component system response regulator VicR
MARVLIVDDAPDLTMLLSDVLGQEGYEVAVAHDAQQGLQLAHDLKPDLVLLDIIMPGMDGWEMLTRLRGFSDVPVIMLTAIGDTEHRVRGLDIGADDYVSKPFDMHELTARMRALLRRAGQPPTGVRSTLSFDDGRLIIHPDSHRVVSQGKEVNLTPIEHRLLVYLASNAGWVMTDEQILQNVWGPGYEDCLTNVKVYVRRLRQKIEADPDQPRYILTRWGVGYCLAKI